MPAVLKGPHPAAIRIEEITHSYQDFRYRAPYKFGGFAVDRVTLLNVECVVRLSNGRSAKGFGSMTMGNNWSFPSRVMTYDQTLGAMKVLAEKINGLTGGYREYGHPIDLNFALEPSYLKAAEEVTRDLHLAEPIPKLCTLVTASPFDAAVHDAFGKIHGRNVYQTYGPDLLPNDISKYLGRQYAGRVAESIPSNSADTRAASLSLCRRARSAHGVRGDAPYSRRSAGASRRNG